jgi:hypothetical protein
MKRSVIIIFFILAFLSGLYVYSTQSIQFVAIPMDKPKENLQNIQDKTAKCPNVLIRNGNVLLLYNSTNTHDELPIQFNSLDEYTAYYEQQKAMGSNCPVLYLQQENDVQGNDVYRARPSPYDTQGGMPPITVGTPVNQLTGNVPMTFPPAAPIIDSDRTQGKFNANNYPGFDPMGLQQGVFSKLDEVHYSTGTNGISDNPMDPNWGGVEFSQAAVESGKYVENNVYPMSASRGANTQFFPGLYSNVIADPPNIVNTRQG